MPRRDLHRSASSAEQDHGLGLPRLNDIRDQPIFPRYRIEQRIAHPQIRRSHPRAVSSLQERFGIETSGGRRALVHADIALVAITDDPGSIVYERSRGKTLIDISVYLRGARVSALIHASNRVASFAVIEGSEITLFTRLLDAVAAYRFEGAVVEARIGVVGVSIIALLLTGPDNSVPAPSSCAAHEAAVVVACISVVTRLARRNYPITTQWNGASIGATVGVAEVAVVALLLRWLADSISADIYLARGEAIIGIDRVPIVTLLAGVISNSITAYIRLAGVEATVRVGGVSIVASFTRLHESITTSRWATHRGAEVVVIGVPVVAHLPTVRYPITAEMRFALQTGLEISSLELRGEERSITFFC